MKNIYDDQLEDVLILMNQSHVRQILEGDSSLEPMSTRQRAIERIDYLASLMMAEAERARLTQAGLNMFRVEKLLRPL